MVQVPMSSNACLFLLDMSQRSCPNTCHVRSTLCADNFWSSEPQTRYSESVHRDLANLGRLLPRFAAHFVSSGALADVERLASECLAHPLFDLSIYKTKCI